MKLKLTFLFLGFLMISSSILLSQDRAEDLKKLTEAYITAFNSGEGAMQAFIMENFSKSALEQRPLEMRLDVYKQMRQTMVEISLHKIEESTSTSISAFMHTKNDDWFIFTFMIEEQPPNKMVGIRIENTDEPESTDEPKLSEIESLRQAAQFLNEQVKKDKFSGTVLISKNGKAVFHRSYGLASKEFKAANKKDTKFNLGSINKIFTTVAIGQLFEEGKLTVDDPIIKFLPDYPNQTAARKVTIRHLLDMTAGIGDFFGEKFENTPKDKFRTISDFFPMFAGDSLRFEPGTQKQYSNGGFIVLGAIIEKASGKSYYDYVREHIFAPLNMSNSDSYEADAIISNLAEGYTRDEADKSWRKNIYTRPARGSSAGGGYSTTEDLLKFTIALDKRTLFKDSNTWNTLRGEMAETKSEKKSGLAFFGGAPGINAGVATNVGIDYTVIVMSNYDPPAAESIMKKIRGILKRVQ